MGSDEMPEPISFRLNGKEVAVTAEPDAPLLYILRNDEGLNGPKFGCGLAQCGACAVLKDGAEIRSCVTTLESVAGSDITTSEGLAKDGLHPLQKAFVQEQAAQCGYCISGMVIAATSLLAQKPKPTLAEIKSGMDGHLCRCGTYLRIIRAIQRVAQEGSKI
jgi:aerobic-type carbon monoxide dehydrogenase small subunit (CoxS/CutS family)